MIIVAYSIIFLPIYINDASNKISKQSRDAILSTGACCSSAGWHDAPRNFQSPCETQPSFPWKPGSNPFLWPSWAIPVRSPSPPRADCSAGSVDLRCSSDTDHSCAEPPGLLAPRRCISVSRFRVPRSGWRYKGSSSPWAARHRLFWIPPSGCSQRNPRRSDASSSRHRVRPWFACWPWWSLRWISGLSCIFLSICS